MMKRDAALGVLARHYPEGIVVPVYQAAFDWMAIRPHPLNYLCTGAMGQAVSHGLGLALGCPEEKIVVLDGDGSLLMNLGALVTVAHAAPANLVHFVCCNAIYEVNGRFPLPCAGDVDFAGMARAAGIPHVLAFDDVGDLEARLGEVFQLQGPVFVVLHVEQGAAHPHDYVAIHSDASRRTFRAALRARRTVATPA
ncbi:thiamine pyrophosphate-dependent enzyme [Geminicoccaceae bacterium 1502E]|nr:thiamine pyrophosphate-dependent enzyme [Geminicoccaceae bacterium 1502E]